MKKLAIIFILIFNLAMAQKDGVADVTSKGYIEVWAEDSLVSNHSRDYKAQIAAENYLRKNKHVKSVRIIRPPLEVRIDWNKGNPIEIDEFRIDTVYATGQTETAVIIYLDFNKQNVEQVYVKFRELGGAWIETNRSLSNIHSPGLLKPDTNYEYMVYAVDSFGRRINSDLLTFKTK